MSDIIFSHTKMAAWRRCKLRYKWQYLDKYQTPPSSGQIKGSVGHSGLAEWYRSGSRTSAIKVASAKLFEYERTLNLDLGEDWELLELVLDRYMEWSEENDDFSAVLGIEEKFVLDVMDFKLKGFIDGIVTMNGVNWLLEHKFMAQARTKHLELDPQVSIYLYAARKLGFDPRGVLYNVVRMGKTGISDREPVVRLPVYRNLEGLIAIEHEMINQMQDIENFHAGAGLIYRNPTADCSWDCGFFDACLSINDSGNAISVLKRFPQGEFFDSDAIVEDVNNGT
jgi:hypothetical protein